MSKERSISSLDLAVLILPDSQLDKFYASLILSLFIYILFFFYIYPSILHLFFYAHEYHAIYPSSMSIYIFTSFPIYLYYFHIFVYMLVSRSCTTNVQTAGKHLARGRIEQHLFVCERSHANYGSPGNKISSRPRGNFCRVFE